MAQIKFDGKVFHCSVCGAFAPKRADVRCSHLVGTKALSGDYIEIEDFPSRSKPDPYSEIRKMGEREELANRNAKMEEIIWRAMAKVRGDRIIQREIDMELCPCSPPAIAVDLGYAVPSHIRYWPI